MAEGDFNTVVIGHLGQVRPPSGEKWMIRAAAGASAQGSPAVIRVGSRSSYVEVGAGALIGMVLDNTNYVEYHNANASPTNFIITYLELN